MKKINYKKDNIAVIVQVVAIIIPSLVTGIIAYKSLSIQQKSTNYQQITVINQMIEKFNSNEPEKVVIYIEILNNMINIDKSVSAKINKYAMAMTENKIAIAKQQNNESSYLELGQIYKTLSLVENDSATSYLTKEIENIEYYIIVASALSKENAIKLSHEISKKTNFKNNIIISAPSGYAVSIGRWKYSHALENITIFSEESKNVSGSFDKTYLQRFKPEWKILQIADRK